MKILRPLRILHGRLYEWQRRMLPFYLGCMNKTNTIFLILTPEHGNLGDHAITESEIAMLKEMGLSCVEVSSVALDRLIKGKLLWLMNGAPILVNGGGFLGTLWYHDEEQLREVIKKNPNSPILLFPNTIYYEDSRWGRRECKYSTAIYNAHNNLKVYAREMTSYKKMSKIYRQVGLAPDMVLRLNECRPDTKRSGCVLCLRSDIEKTISESDSIEIMSQVKALFGDDIKSHDMVRPYSISRFTRTEELNKQFDIFRHAELVVTDRLHGMIFSAVTGTPCIVVNSKSPKIKGCYQWIQDLEYVQFCDEPKQITTIYRNLPKGGCIYNNKNFFPLYRELQSDIMKMVERK